MRIRHLDNFPPELDGIASTARHATFYHTGAWLLSLNEAFKRLQLQCLVAEDGGRIVGYMPFFNVTRGLVRAVWSLPFGTYGGPVELEGSEVFHRLIESYSRLCRSLNVLESGWIDFHNRGGAAATLESASAHVVDLKPGFDHVWSQEFSKKRRQYTRKAERAGVQVRRSTGHADLLGYYNIFAGKMEEWGQRMTYPLQFFEGLCDRGGDNVRLYVAVHDDEIVAGHFNFYYGDSVIAWFNMTSAAGDSLQAGSLLYTRCMGEAARQGFASYNLGGSIGKSSLVGFKESLGGREHSYQVFRRSSPLGRVASWVRNFRRTR